jgi:flagellar biogenesis protein FliO
MSPLFRTALFLFLAAPLYAQAPPPLPPRPPQSNKSDETLAGLRAMTGAKATPPQSVQPAQQDDQLYDYFLPPKLLNRNDSSSTIQASFSTRPISPSNESSDERRFEEPLYDENLPDAPNAMLDKPLLSRKKTKEHGDITEEGESKTSGWTNKLVKPELTPLFSVGGSLFIVIAAFFLLVVLFRKVSPQGNRPLPKEAFECLGKYFLTQKHQLQVLRLGSRIVLVSVMPDGISTIAEITDPDEAVSFLGLCRRLDTNSATELFRKTVAGMSEDELSRPHERPAVTNRRKGQPAASFDMYSDPDESLSAILARGRQR